MKPTDPSISRALTQSNQSNLSMNQSINQFIQAINKLDQSINQSGINQSITHSHKQPNNQSVNQTTNQTIQIKQSINQSINRFGGWGWKRSGAESPTGNPSPAPIAIAAHASHARHDRSMARWISVARAKVGGWDSSPPDSRKVAPSPACPFVHFELGNIMVLLRTCPNRLTKIRVL